MLPSSTSNDPPDARMRRGARRSSTFDGSTIRPPIFLALDSPAERVAARKRALLRGRLGSASSHQASTVPGLSLEEGSSDRPLEDSSAGTSMKQKKKLIPTNSTRSLDSVAGLLEQERIERLQTENGPRRSQSHHMRQSSEISQGGTRIMGPISTGPASSSGSNAAQSFRSSLPDFKTMFRHMIPSKRQEQHERLRTRSASERSARTTYAHSHTDVQSAHRRTQSGENRRVSDTDLFIASDRPTDEETTSTRRRSTPASADSAAAAATTTTASNRATAMTSPSPGLMKKLWHKSAATSQRLNSPSSNAGLSLDQERQNSGEDQTIVSQDSSMEDSSNDQPSQGTSRRPLTSVLGSKLKRKSKRVDLVQELSLRDSLRVRDRDRRAPSSSAAQHSDDSAPRSQQLHSVQQSPPQQPAEFSTEEEWQVAKFMSFPTDTLRGAETGDRDRKAEVRSPFDDTKLRSSKPTTKTATVSGVAALLSSTATTSSSASSSLIEVDGHRGHSSWPVTKSEPAKDAPAPRRKSNRRSMSGPSLGGKSLDESGRKSKKKDQIASTKPQAGGKTGRSSSKTRADSKARKDSQRLSQSSRHSLKSNRVRGGSVPPAEDHPRQRKASQSQELNSSSDHIHGGSRASRSEHKASSGTKSRKKQGSYSSLLQSSSERHASTTNVDSSVRRSLSKKKPKSKREEMSSSKSRRHRRIHSSGDRVDKRIPKTLPKRSKTSGVEDISERSLTVDDIARLDESRTSLVDDSKATLDAEAKARKKKKAKKSASSSSRLHSSSRSSKYRKSETKSDSRPWRSEPSGLELSGSFDESKSDSRRKDKELVKKSIRRCKTEEKLTKKSPSTHSKTRETKLPRSVGKSPAKSPKVRTRKKETKDEASGLKTGESNWKEDSKKSPSKRDSVLGAKGVATITGGPARTKEPAKKGTEMPPAPKRKSEGIEEQQRVSIESYLNKDAEATVKTANKHDPDAESTNNDSGGQLPSLADFCSVDLSTDSSKTKSTHSTEEALKALPEESQAKGAESGKARQLLSVLKRDESPMKEEQLSSLDAIVEDSKPNASPRDLEDPTQRESLDDLALHAVDIFHDSPDGSPLSSSLPILWQSRSREAVVESLVSSMPNLDYHHHKPSRTDGSKSSSKVAHDEGIFQDDSDDSPPSHASLPDLKPMCDDNRVDVMAEIAGQLEERHEKKVLHLQPRPASGEESFRASLISEFRLGSSPRQPSAVDEAASPSLVKETKGKHDRGPRKPQRRSDSFEDSQASPPPLEGLSPVPRHLDSSLEWGEDTDSNPESSEEETPSFPLVFSSTDMEFQRTDDQGWVQTPTEETLDDLEPPSLSSSAEEFSVRRFDAATVLRRSASMSDLEDARAIERWNANAAPKSDTPPSFSRSQSSSERPSSVSMGGNELRGLYSLPKGSGTKEAARTYLPVSLQSAARRHERAGRLSPRLAARNRQEVGRPVDSRGVAVETVLSDMFEMIGELEEDLNQVAILRAQRRARLLEESGEPEPES